MVDCRIQWSNAVIEALRRAFPGGGAVKLPPPVELCRIRRVSPTLGFASVRLPGVLLNSLQIQVQYDGGLRISPPSTADRNGVPWPCYSLQPGTKEIVEMAIAAVWAQAEGGQS
jgi:hypothetical protein